LAAIADSAARSFPSFDREAIEAEIDRVRSLDLDELRTLWRVTFRSSPPSGPAVTASAGRKAPPPLVQ
jgi:hypothetical protein